MQTASDTTVADGLSYAISWPEFETLEEAVEATKGSDELLAAINKRIQKQGATQGGKQAVRDALDAAREAGFTLEDCQEAVDNGDDGGDEALAKLLQAVAGHQESSAGYVVGQTRSSAGGMTKTKARRGGEALAEALGEEEYRKMLIEHFGEERAEQILAGEA